jgi:hypothetical protein
VYLFLGFEYHVVYVQFLLRKLHSSLTEDIVPFLVSQTINYTWIFLRNKNLITCYFSSSTFFIDISDYGIIQIACLHIFVICIELLFLQLVSCRVLPWAKRNLNYTAQALIISAGTMLCYSKLSMQSKCSCCD